MFVAVHPAAGPGTCFFTLCRASVLHFCSVWACLVKMAAVVQCGDWWEPEEVQLAKKIIDWLHRHKKSLPRVSSAYQRSQQVQLQFWDPGFYLLRVSLIGWSKIWWDLARRLITTQSAHCNRLKCSRVLPVSSDSFLLNKLLYLFSFSQSIARNRNRLSASLTLQYSLASSV